MMTKTTEKPMVMAAPIGLSQKDSCSNPTWRATKGRSLSPRNEPLIGTSDVPLAPGVGRAASDEERVALIGCRPSSRQGRPASAASVNPR